MASSNEQIFSSQNKERKKEKKRIKAQRALMQASFTECKSTSDTPNCSPGNRTERTGNSQLYFSADDLDDKYNHEGKDVPCAAGKNVNILNSKTVMPKQECDPFYEEDVIDGFAILSFSSYKDLEETVKIFEKTSQLPDPYQQLETKENVKKSKQDKCKQARVNGAVRNWLTKESGVAKSGHNGDREKPQSETKNPQSGRATPNSCSSQLNTQGTMNDCETEPKQAQVDAKRGPTPPPRIADIRMAPLPSNPAVTSSAGTGSAEISNSVRWVGLASSPRPATAVAPHGPIQGGPRLPDCQPTEGGAGPSPAPPATYSPQLPAQSTSNSPTGMIQPSSPHIMNPNYRGHHPPHSTVFSASSLCTAPPTHIGHQPFFPSPSSSGSRATPPAPVAPPTASFLAPEVRHRETLPPTTISAAAASLGNRQMRPGSSGPQPSVSPVSRAPSAGISSQSYSPSFSQIPTSQAYLGAHHTRPGSRMATIVTTPAGLLAPSPPTGPHRHTPITSATSVDPRSLQASPASIPRPPISEVTPLAQSRFPLQTSRPMMMNFPPVPPAFHAPSLSSWPRLPQPEMYNSPSFGPRLPVSTSAGPDRFLPARDVPIPTSSSHAPPHSQFYPAACAETYSTMSRGEASSRPAPPPVVSTENTVASKTVDPLLLRSMHPPYHGVQSTLGTLPTSLTTSLGGQVNSGTTGAQRNLGLHASSMETKPGRWNTMHVRVAWEIYRQQQLQQPDRKTTLTSSIPSRLNFSGPSRVPNPYEPVISSHSAPPPFTFGHSIPSFMSRQSSAQPTQRITTPPTAPLLQNLPSRRPSPAPDAWPRMAGSAAIPTTAPWLAPLARSNVSSVAKSEPTVATSSSSASMTHSALMAREREWQKREERIRERERSESEREKEKERTRHGSRSPLPHRGPHQSNGPLRNESPAVKPMTYPPVCGPHGLPHLGSFHPSLQTAPQTAVSASGLMNFPHTFDPFRDVPREMESFRENLEREQREYLRMGAGSSLLHPPVGLGPPMPPPPLFHATPPVTSTADRYHDFAALTSSLSQERFRDGLLLPGHLAHMPPMGGMPMPSSSSFSDRYRELASYSGGMPGLHGLGGNSVYNTPVSAVMFPPGLAPPPLLSTAGLGAMGGMSLLPPLLSGAGKRTPPPSTLAPNLGSTFAALGRNHLGMMPGLGIPPYPLPSPSPMLQPHLLPPLGPGLANAAASVGRSLLDMPMPGYNPLDFQRKDDTQNR